MPVLILPSCFMSRPLSSWLNSRVRVVQLCHQTWHADIGRHLRDAEAEIRKKTAREAAAGR
jgi:hypothetical protein